MLKSLYIRGLAVVDELQLEFEPGLTVFTGETGAGKSILLTAMGLCLGDRADTSYIRPGLDRAEVSLEFDVQDSESAQNWLREQAMDDEDGNCLIRRVIQSDGRSRAFINGQPVTLQLLQLFTEHLINIHGQHDHLLLMKSDVQREILDQNAPDSICLGQCNQAHADLARLQQERNRITQGQGTPHDQLELLRYQIEELQSARVSELNYENLVAEHTQLANMEQILTVGESQLDRLYENTQQSIHDLLSDSMHELEQIAGLSSDFESAVQQLQEMTLLLQDCCRDLRRTLDNKEHDPNRLSELDDQLDRVHALSRKLSVQPQELGETLVRLETRLDEIEHQSERMAKLQQELDHALSNYLDASVALSRQRALTAADLSAQISKSLSLLGMPDGQFKIEVQHQPEAKPQRWGQDQIVFQVTTNPGLPLKPISKVASGGELSRICLAIQVTTQQSATASTLIFDEVDSGIGGGIAETVGQLLRQIGCKQQVFCVTHLPQVAAQGHHHLKVSKSQTDGQTRSDVRPLVGKVRIDEIARMLGGREISDTTLAHAEEMLSGASA